MEYWQMYLIGAVVMSILVTIMMGIDHVIIESEHEDDKILIVIVAFFLWPLVITMGIYGGFYLLGKYIDEKFL